MKLVFGLGNPGAQYRDTRHNVGYAVLAELARRYGTGRAKEKFHAEVMDASIGGVATLLISPLTFMNRSGLCVQAARDFYKLANDQLLVVCDDFNLPLGRLRFRAAGSSGGQKGLESIVRTLGSERFPRLRIGIGSPPPGWDAADYVLGRFRAEEVPEIKLAIQRAADGVADWVTRGIEYCMNQYNVRSPEEPDGRATSAS